MVCGRGLSLAPWVGSCLGLLLPGLVGCAIWNGFLDPTKVGMFPLEYKERGIRRILTPRDTPPGLPNATEPTPEDLVPIYEEYRLGPGDVLGVIVYDLVTPGAPEVMQMEVGSTGNVRIPKLGTVRISGLTEQEAEEELKARLREAGLLPDADVRVYAQAKRGEVFTIRGAVGRPGTYPITEPDTRMLDLVGMVGDISPSVPRIYIIRRAQPAPEFEGAEVPPEEPEDEGLIILPPPDEEDFQTDFSATYGLATREPPPPVDEPELEKADLEALFAPGQATQPTTDRVEVEAEPPFAPLIFDPQTGELVEPEPERPPAEEWPPVEAVPPPAEAPFEWEDIPEMELEQRVIEINVRDLFAGDPRSNIVIRSKDVINVPIDTGLFYLMGEVNRPGAYAFNGRDITIKQALAMAGGFSPFAWPSRCEIIRHEPGTDKQVTIPVNLDLIFAGWKDDFFLRDDDIVNVGTHVVAPFLFVIRNSFRFTYGFGFVYDRNFADKDAFGGKMNPEIRKMQEAQRRGLPF